MPPISSEALVLRTYKLGETSKIVVLLTRERGKLRAVARGARGPRSRYRSALEPLSEVRASLYGRQGAELFRLGECELVRSAFRTGSRLDLSLALSYFAELLDAFSPEGEAEDAVYRLARAVLSAADEGAPAASLARYMEAWLLKLHGIYPPLDRCARCQGALPAGDLWYDAAAHGFVCTRCPSASGPVIPSAGRDFLAALLSRPPAKVGPPPPEGAVLEPFHRDLITRHLERGLRSPRVIDGVARELP